MKILRILAMNAVPFVIGVAWLDQIRREDYLDSFMMLGVFGIWVWSCWKDEQ